jgi:hypothetical protein
VANPSSATEELHDSVDVDKFLDSLIDEYIEARKKNLKLIAKNFSKLLENENGLFAFEDIKDVFLTVNAFPSSPFPGYSFPKDMHFLNVFIFSIKKNSLKVYYKFFI